ncbi:S-DNA-T family DNA segregation ATPase FtsK/SpoIIIE [Actinoplanes octamycinicus]|uniref:S-DNA-T family DNA segregation ATPase FtsK/SpoIIIE n=1 Tax=Actinoplanes octamycinicus TaxID=135948 RepID=A0A7W7MBM8_9ACTN|nr:FtsK/SpoIIIE domain-containing protein [Actinoplanes octamycinicus]MBB4744212.1 S-DNA-T family DNA segregation ATPase FtsK/SpoIIIE [Actinoplanes octamycinicus]
MLPDDRAPARLPSPPRDLPDDRLRIDIGRAADGTPVQLDLKEAVDGGIGPHGLIAGDGTPHLLRSIVLGLAAKHVPDEVTFVLLDATTGTFDGLDRLPHTAVLLDAASLAPTGSASPPPTFPSHTPTPAASADRPSTPPGSTGPVPSPAGSGAPGGDLVPRLIDVLEGESARRKRLLVAAGCASHSAYLRKTANHPPMPALVLICHGFPALLDNHPPLREVVRRLGWLGRARGIHLLLAAPTTADMSDLAGYLAYRIALPAAPDFVLDSPAARSLSPGQALLRTGTDQPARFTLINTPAPTETSIPGDTPAPTGTSDHHASAQPGSDRDHRPAVDPAGRLDHLSAGPQPTHRIWLPPLDAAPALDELAGPVVSDPDQRLVFADRTLHGALQVPIAILDKPREHRRDTIWLPIAGNVAVVGGPGSGKTTILRTLTVALSLSHTAPALRVVAPTSLTHAAAAADIGAPASLTETAPAVATEAPAASTDGDSALTATPRANATDSPAEPTDYQRLPLVHGMLGDRSAADDVKRDLYARLDDPRGDTIVVIDDWAAFWDAHPHWHELLLEIAQRGTARGVHLVATATQWSDFDPRLADHFGSRLELRLTDPGKSGISPTAAAAVPSARPGRGIVAAPGHPGGALHFLATRPELTTTRHADLLSALATEHCAECGFTYDTVTADELPARLRAAGSLFAAALLAVADLRRRPAPETWSALEYTCHVRDVLQVQRERLTLARSTDNPEFPPMGRDERVITDAYNSQDPHTVLTGLDQAGEALAAAFATLPPAGFARTGIYNWPTATTRTMLWLGRHTVHEVVHHLLDIARQPRN